MPFGDIDALLRYAFNTLSVWPVDSRWTGLGWFGRTINPMASIQLLRETSAHSRARIAAALRESTPSFR